MSTQTSKGKLMDGRRLNPLGWHAKVGLEEGWPQRMLISYWRKRDEHNDQALRRDQELS
jgi:hypothetical protein